MKLHEQTLDKILPFKNGARVSSLLLHLCNLKILMIHQFQLQDEKMLHISMNSLMGILVNLSQTYSLMMSHLQSIPQFSFRVTAYSRNDLMHHSL